jgi:hypothetical protein
MDFFANQNKAMTTLIKLQSYGLTEDQILSYVNGLEKESTH